jgi:O-antigen ligase
MSNILSKNDNYILKTIKVLLFFCAAIPVFASRLFLFPYTAPKAFLFRIIIEITLGLYLYLILKGSAPKPWKFFSGKNVVSLAVIFLAAAWFLSSIVGIDSNASFWGTFERMIGFWGILHFAVFYFLLINVFREKGDWALLLKISVAASFVIAVLGILQRFIGLGSLLPQTSRIASLIGNASFLATYLLTNLFFVAYLFLKEIIAEKKEPRFSRAGIYIFIFVIIFCAMFLTATRGALLGFFAGAIIFSAVFIFWGKGNARRYFAGILLFFILLAVFAFVFRESVFFQNNSVLRRFSSMTFEDSSVKNRLMLWRGAWGAWQEKPILGWGSESFETAINKYFDPRLNYDEAWYDRAHNFIFDYGVSGGWLGLLSYLSLFGAGVFCLVKIRRRDFFFFVVFSSLLAAYLIQAFFVFDIFISYLMLFLTLGIIAVYSSGFPQNGENIKSKHHKICFGKKTALALAAILIVFSVYSFNIKPLYASYLANSAIALPVENYEQVNLLFERAENFNIFGSNEIAYQITLDYLEKMNSAPELAKNEEFFELSSANLKKDIDISPLQIKNYIALAWLNLYFSGKDSGRIGEAIVLAQKAKELALAKKDGYMVLAAAYAMSGSNVKAREVVREAAAIDAGLGKIIEKYLDKF